MQKKKIMSLQSNHDKLVRLHKNPALPIVGSLIFHLLSPLNDFLVALDRLVRSFSCGASLTDHLFYWPSELVHDLVDNFFVVTGIVAMIFIFFAAPYAVASVVSANETIMNMVFFVPMVFGSLFLLSMASEWVVKKANKLMDSPLANRESDHAQPAQPSLAAAAAAPEVKKAPQVKQKFIL